MARTTLADVPILWAQSKPFQCNANLTGSDDTFFASTGMLPDEWVPVFHHSLYLRYGYREHPGRPGHPDGGIPDHPYALSYVVTSYQTPIAWKLNDGTIMLPNNYYTPTTRQHQHCLTIPDNHNGARIITDLNKARAWLRNARRFDVRG